MGGKGERSLWNLCRGPMDKDNRGVRIECGSSGWVGQRRVMGTTVIEQQ